MTLATRSFDFIKETFSEGDYSDVVYVTANPFFHESKFEELTGRKPEDVFHAVYHTYLTDWNEEESTVLPEKLIRDAKNAKKLFPDEKLIVHFMQPHYPFINSDLTKKGINPQLDNKQGESVWIKAEKGEYTQDKVWKAYKENLEFVTPKAKKLGLQLKGKSVITADHGNLVGENGIYGHDLESKAKALREVPWDQI